MNVVAIVQRLMALLSLSVEIPTVDSGKERHVEQDQAAPRRDAAGQPGQNYTEDAAGPAMLPQRQTRGGDMNMSSESLLVVLFGLVAG
jgi:hypothetical protein